MTKTTTLLNERFNTKQKPEKMRELATLSLNGNLSSFAGIFQRVALSGREKNSLERIFLQYGSEGENFKADLEALTQVTSEVKAIDAQSVILHGERIKKAGTILKNYRTGAFTSWLLITYGNRQTPYNFLLYYELYEQLSKENRLKVEKMPKQAVYTLAAREGALKDKEQMISAFAGESKQELLLRIREKFPLPSGDRRTSDCGESALKVLSRLHRDLILNRGKLAPEQKKSLSSWLFQLQHLLLEV